MTWKPISSAPKDGTRVLIAGCNQVDLGLWCGEGWIDDGFLGYENENWITHWMPLPAPPRSTLADSDGDDGA